VDSRPLVIAGDEAWGRSGEFFETFDPASGAALARVSRASPADVDDAVRAARSAVDGSSEWHLPRTRVAALLRLAGLISDRAEELAALESRDTGKPLAQARADVEIAERYFTYYAGLADKLDGRTVPLGPGYLDYTVREPWGVCAIITPWNYPVQIGARGIAPALASGNAVILKPSVEAPLTSIEFGRLATAAGVPRGWLSVLPGSGADIGSALVTHPGVDHISFTGSTLIGSEIGRLAAGLTRPVTMELGGKSPNIVFGDADLDRAVGVIVMSIIQNAGQTCSAGSRLLVSNSIATDLVERLVAAFGRVTLGPGIDDPDLGPLISERQRDDVERRVAAAVEAGGRIAAGGTRPSDGALSRGYFYRPTLLTDVPPSTPILSEEVFGPVLSVQTFNDEEEALRLANEPEYGLVAAVWTSDLGRAHRMARGIRAGQVFINTYGAAGGIELPFGGYRRSGYGRSKGLEGILDFTQVKNVCVAIN